MSANQFLRTSKVFIFTAVAAFFVVAAPASADEPVADEPVADEPAADEPAADEPAAGELDTHDVIEPEAAPAVIERANTIRYGMGLRFHVVTVPKGVIELFAEKVPSGMTQPGFALDFTRRRDDFEINIGVAYERISFSDGLWTEKGNGTLSSRTDFVEFSGAGLLALEAIFLSHTEIADGLYLRYGGGFGIGLLIGDILQTDTTCTGTEQSSCTPITSGPGDIEEPASPFPVYPVITFLGGLQYKPAPDVAVSLETGIRNVPFVGMNVQYYFN